MWKTPKLLGCRLPVSAIDMVGDVHRSEWNQWMLEDGVGLAITDALTTSGDILRPVTQGRCSTY
jgi:hypothetical protein